MKVLVTGATGFIGKKIVHALAREGHQIVVLSRNAENAKGKFAAPVTAFSWNPTEEKAPAAAFDGVEAVISLAGEGIAEKRWTEKQKKAIHDSRVLGTRHLAETLRGLGKTLKVFVSSSAIGLYGDRGDEQLPESAAPGTDFLADVCADWEKAASEVPAERTVLVRTGIVLGREGGMLKKVLPIFKTGLAGPLGNGRQYMSWIHVDDIVGIFLHAFKNAAVKGAINGAAPAPVTNAEFTKALGHALSRPAFLPAPAFALKLALGELSVLLLGSQKVVPDKTLKTGYSFLYPGLDEALSNLIKKKADESSRASKLSNGSPVR